MSVLSTIKYIFVINRGFFDNMFDFTPFSKLIDHVVLSATYNLKNQGLLPSTLKQDTSL